MSRDDYTLSCLEKAFKMMEEEHEGKGNVYFITDIGQLPLYHAYYVKDETILDDEAISPEDFGITYKPALKVRQVLEHGRLYTRSEKGTIVPVQSDDE